MKAHDDRYKLQRMDKYAVFIALFIHLLLNQVSGQSLSFNHFAVRDGISQSVIICICQDSEGFLWFGTQNGLNRFDGYSFVSYFNDPYDTTSLSNNWIFSIAEDSTGGLWIATKGGLNRYDKKTGLFNRINHKGTGTVITDNFVYGLCTDKENVYVNFPPELAVINVKTGHKHTFRNDSWYSGVLYDNGVPVIKAKNGFLWIGTHHGLFRLDPETNRYRVFLHDPENSETISHNHITALSEDRDGRILCGTEHGLNIIDPVTFRIKHYFHREEHLSGLSHNLIRAVRQDHTGAIWIGTEGGGLNKMIFPADKGEPQFIHFMSGTDTRHLISHNIVFSLYEDFSNNLWIGTIAGLDKTDLKKKNIRFYKKSDDPGSVELPDNVIASVFKNKSGNLWVGTWGKGLVELTPDGKVKAGYSSGFRGKYHIPDDYAHVLYLDGYSRLWLGTRNGVAVFDPVKGAFVNVSEYFGTESFDVFTGIRVYNIIEDSEGKLWIGTSNGVVILNIRNKTIRMLKASPDEALSLSSNLVYSVLEDRDKDIWIATSNGLDRYNPYQQSMIHYVHNSRSTNTLCDNFTISLGEDLRGNIWIGTASGLNRFNKASGVFTYYSVKSGLPGSVIYDIIDDASNNLWFSTGRGLAIANPNTGDPVRFQALDEFIGQEFNIKAVFRSSDGEMFFGGMDGLVSFFPDSLNGNTYIPPLKITTFEKENDGVRKNLNVYEPEISLSYKDYSFSIDFSALDFTNPGKNRYAYQMEGISSKWNNTGNHHSVQFTRLPAGDYVFRVKGTNNDGVWNEIPANLKIHISPPWWRSRLAYLVYAVIILIGIVVIIKLRERNLLREKKILELKVNERTIEIARQKAKVEESEEKLKSTINSLDDLVFVLDNEGIFQEFYNPRKRDINFRNPELYIHKHYTKAGISSELVRQLRTAFSSFKERDDVPGFDYNFGSGESKQWYNAKVSPKRNAAGELTGIVIVAREITDRKMAEEQLKEQKEELKELNGMKDKFFSILAHDLKNPFTNLYSLSDLIIRNYTELEENDKLMALQNINKSAGFIFTLLENLLTWANSQRGKMTFSPVPFDLSGLIEVNANLHRIQAENKGIEIKVSTTEPEMAFGDREMIDTVIRNLVSNAIKFTSEGGSIDISIHQKDGNMEVRIKDTGVGIPPGDMDKLFHIDVKYKSTGTAGETGTGLGLVLCSEFVTKNAGRIWCESVQGKGSTFIFTIPAAN